MSLTMEAIHERKWRPFPALRKVLEDKNVPSECYGPSTASDNMFDAMGRLIEIAILTKVYEKKSEKLSYPSIVMIEKKYLEILGG